MKTIKLFIVLAFACLLPYILSAQIDWQPNVASFSDKTPTITNVLLELSPDADEMHPEFGILPYNAPRPDCYEIIGKRTATTRFYVNTLDTNEFYSQTCYGDFHFLDESGQWISYDPRLQPDSVSGAYVAPNQKTPTEINVGSHSGFRLPDGTVFEFNRNLRLKNIADVDTIDLGPLDWSTYTIGDNGLHVINAWENIDMYIIVDLDQIKSNFVIKGPLAGMSEGYLVIEDELALPDASSLLRDDGLPVGNDWVGIMNVSSATGETLFRFDMAIAYDQTALADMYSSPISIESFDVGTDVSYSPISYSFDGNYLSMKLSVEWLSDPARVFPIMWDPIVTSTATYSAGIMLFRYNGTFCAGPNADCSYDLVVPYPPNSTITAATFSSTYNSVSGICVPCRKDLSAFRIYGPCGTFSPGGAFWWSCLGGAGSCIAVNYDMTAIISCLTASPACSGNATFTMRNSYCGCSSGGDCIATSCTTHPNNSWSVTLTGHTVEVLGSLLGSGSTSITMGCYETETLNPLPLYGVPGYTYIWNTGETTATKDFYPAGFEGLTVITCTVTDACGVSVVATFNITSGCLLPIELVDFTATWDGKDVILNWTTASEVGNDYFIVERSAPIWNFREIAQVESTSDGNSLVPQSYLAKDTLPMGGVSYYRLISVDINSYNTIGKTVALEIPEELEIGVFPNPTTTMVNLVATSPAEMRARVEILNILGQSVSRTMWDMRLEEYSIDISEFPFGMYSIVITTKDDNLVFREKIIKQ